MAFANVPQAVQDLRHAHGDGGLARAGIPGERHVQRRCAGCEPHRCPRTFDEQQRSDVADARFHRGKADEIAIEMRKEVADAGIIEKRREVDAPRHHG